jgi:NitT/TauT family transport system substrate-binding protein
MNVGVTRRGVILFAAASAISLSTSPCASVYAQTALKLTLDGRIDVPSAPLLMALERGHFKAEELEVAIEPSTGGVEPFARVASGAFDIGIADINVLIRYRDQNSAAGLKAVFMVSNRASYAVVGRKSRGVMAPLDLQNRRLGLPAAEPASAAWPAFAKVNGIDPAKVRTLNVGVLVREPMLVAGEIDAATGVSYGAPVTLIDKGVPADDVTTFLMSQYGIEMYGSAVFVSAKVLAEKPDAIRAFLRAYARGLKDAVREPGAAVDAVLRRGNGGSRDSDLARLLILFRDSIVTPEVRASGFGGIDPARLEGAIDQIGIGYSFKNKPKSADVFDPSLLPAEGERRID